MDSALFLATAATASPLLHDDELTARWSAPSVLAEFRVSGLAGHLARAVFTVERYLAADPGSAGPPIDAVEYFRRAGDPSATVDDPVQRHIRARGEEAAGAGPVALADEFDQARARLAGRLATVPADQPVLVFDRWLLPLDQALLTRLVELVVHLDDLAVSLDGPTPEVPEEAADLVVATLARLARARHGTVAVVRALARRERAPRVIAAF